MANAARIGMAILNADASEHSYILRLTNQLFARVTEELGVRLIDEATVKRGCARCGGDLDTNDGGQTFFCSRCDGEP